MTGTELYTAYAVVGSIRNMVQHFSVGDFSQWEKFVVDGATVRTVSPCIAVYGCGSGVLPGLLKAAYPGSIIYGYGEIDTEMEDLFPNVTLERRDVDFGPGTYSGLTILMNLDTQLDDPQFFEQHRSRASYVCVISDDPVEELVETLQPSPLFRYTLNYLSATTAPGKTMRFGTIHAVLWQGML